jgi:hypothetical protein
VTFARLESTGDEPLIGVHLDGEVSISPFSSILLGSQSRHSLPARGSNATSRG